MIGFVINKMGIIHIRNNYQHQINNNPNYNLNKYHKIVYISHPTIIPSNSTCYEFYGNWYPYNIYKLTHIPNTSNSIIPIYPFSFSFVIILNSNAKSHEQKTKTKPKKPTLKPMLKDKNNCELKIPPK